MNILVRLRCASCGGLQRSVVRQTTMCVILRYAVVLVQGNRHSFPFYPLFHDLQDRLLRTRNKQHPFAELIGFVQSFQVQVVRVLIQIESFFPYFPFLFILLIKRRSFELAHHPNWKRE